MSNRFGCYKNWGIFDGSEYFVDSFMKNYFEFFGDGGVNDDLFCWYINLISLFVVNKSDDVLV